MVTQACFLRNYIVYCGYARKELRGASIGRPEQVEKVINRVMELIADFSLDELRELRFELEERVGKLQGACADQPIAEVAGEIHPTLREEWKKCGKPSCQCSTEGKLHGPYLYEYWKQGGRTHSRYLGKK